MGITCKPIGKQKSILTKLQNQMEVEEKKRAEEKLKKSEKKLDKKKEM